jgi:hypothetical protein
MLRAIRRLFGMPSSRPEVVNYQQAAKALFGPMDRKPF